MKIQAVLGTVVLWAVVAISGCTRYPQVEFANLKYVAALRTACSAKDTTWLTQAKEAIEEAHGAGTIGDDEYAAYERIVALAESGEWIKAEAECVRFQKEQLAK
jgi:hypothetical protein